MKIRKALTDYAGTPGPRGNDVKKKIVEMILDFPVRSGVTQVDRIEHHMGGEQVGGYENDVLQDDEGDSEDRVDLSKHLMW